MRAILAILAASMGVGCAAGYANEAPSTTALERARSRRLQQEQQLTAQATQDATGLGVRSTAESPATEAPRAYEFEDEPVNQPMSMEESVVTVGAQSSRRARRRAARQSSGASPPAAPAAPPSPEDQLNARAAGDARLAQNASASDTATDAVDTSGPLLVYTAVLGLAAYRVQDKIDRVEAIAQERRGFLASRTMDRIVIRVPAAQFEAALAEVQELGDVVTRQVDVQDVGEEFRDVETRIRTLEQMQERLAELLAAADDVQAALAVEQQLERITLQLETLKGRLRFLSDQVAFSTISVRFAERAPQTEPSFELPFPWLRQLGLDPLMRL
ncbi:MAG: DUF4349 domain-containing protein [Myxococcota bacterium]